MSKLTKKNIIKVIICLIFLSALIPLYLFESTSFSVKITRIVILIFFITSILSLFKNLYYGTDKPVIGKTYYLFEKKLKPKDPNNYYCYVDDGKELKTIKVKSDREVPFSKFIVYLEPGYFYDSTKEKFEIHDDRAEDFPVPWKVKNYNFFRLNKKRNW